MPDHTGYRLPDDSIPVLLSSDTVEGLCAEAARLVQYLRNHPAVTPDAVADTIFRTRVVRRHRALAMVRTHGELLEAAVAVAQDRDHSAVVSGTAAARRIGFVFPGQGSQWPGMGALYYELSQAYRDEVDACAEFHRERFGHDRPLHYLLGAQDRYQETVWEIQPALMFHMAGLAAMWQAAGVRPDATVGHSQGELTAGAVSGIMTRRDAVLAVTHRARMVEKIAPRGYSMAVLGLDREESEALLARNSGWAELSVVNSPHIMAISGDRETIADLVATATGRGQFAREIRVAYPAHTSIVAELRDDLEACLGADMSADTFAASDIPCYGATLGAAITPDLTHRQYWYWNLRNRVRFDRATVAAAIGGVDTFVEVSEHPTLQLALQENLTLVPKDSAPFGREFRVQGTSLRTADGLGDFTRNLAAIAVHDAGYPWSVLRTGTDARPPLPDFPNTVMGSHRYWLSPDSGAGVDIPRPAPARPLRLAETWTRLERRSLVPPRDLLIVDPGGRSAALAAAVCTAAHNHGGTARLQSDTAAGYYDTVVVLLPELPEQDGPAAVEEVAAFFAGREWLPDLAGVRDCWLVTVGGESVTAEDPAPHQFHGAVPSGFRSIGMEHLGISFRHLDLAAGQADASVAAALVRAVHIRDEPELALRGAGVYAKRLEVDTRARPGETAEQDLEHVVIIGGTGTLGMRFCERYVELGARRITLLSRSGETADIARRLEALRCGARSAAEIVVTACDVGDPAAVAGVAASIGGRPATLIVHAAVNYAHAELADITAEMVRKVAGSKVFGTENVLRALPRTRGCRVVLCSSLAATFGGRGQILYATVNRMLDVLAHRLRARGVDAVAMQWGLWDLEGPLHAVGVERVEAAGVVAMRAQDALSVGFAEHADFPGAGNRLVASADWADVHAVMSAVGYGQLLERVLVQEDSVPAAMNPDSGPSPAPDRAEPDRTRGAASLSDRVRVELGQVMGVSDVESLESAVPLVALGLDSLQALDFRKRVQARLNRDLPIAAILGGASLDDVVRLMAESAA